jgi:hypothetical protein
MRYLVPLELGTGGAELNVWSIENGGQQVHPNMQHQSENWVYNLQVSEFRAIIMDTDPR